MSAAIPHWIEVDDYFLSPTNPIATADQVHVERTVLRLLAREDVQAAIRTVRLQFGVTSQTASAEALSLLDSAALDHGTNYVFKAANSDANVPRVVQSWMYEHEWFGHRVGAARIGGDNQDNGYRLIPIEHGAAYRIDGRRLNDGPADVTWTVIANSGTSMTLASLESSEMTYEADGRFTVTVDDRPADGRSNHLQTKRGALFLFIRDSLGDWDTERANALTVTRITPPSAAPIDDDEMAWRAIDWMIRDVSLYFWFTYFCIGKPANALAPAAPVGGIGGLVSQYAATNLVRLADDEAYVFRINAGGARYRSIVVHDWWFRSIEPDRRQCSLNNAQMASDEDGGFTLVVARTDPGVHNWLDLGPLHETLVAIRWQGVDADTPEAERPRVLSAELVKLEDIAARTAGARRVTPQERQAQTERRRAAYFARMAP